MNPLYQVDAAMANTIREILDNAPVCPQCGNDADDCGCASAMEEPEKEPSGDTEEIIINPEIDVNTAKQRKVDEWSNAAKNPLPKAHF